MLKLHLVDLLCTAVRLHCCKIDQQNFGGQNSKTPEPIDKKFGVCDYVGDDFPRLKFKMIAAFGVWRHCACLIYHPHVAS